MCVCVCQVKVDEFFEMVSTTVDTYAQLFCDGDMSTFSSSDEAHFVLALSGIITSKYLATTYRVPSVASSGSLVSKSQIPLR